MIELVGSRFGELWLRTGEHVILTGAAIGVATLVGIPIAILASRQRWLRGPLMGAVGILQTVPSLAMLAFLLALLQRIGALPAIVALTLYALLPIVRNTLTGVEGVPDDVSEAAVGIGMTARQELWLVRFPLALPVILAGIRTAAVIGVGIATLVAFIGAGGLGQFIVRGLALSDTGLILLGAVPAALLALLVDGSLAAAEWGFRRTREVERRRLRTRLKPVAVGLPLLVIGLGVAAYFTAPSPRTLADGTGTTGTVRIGSKNFSEQFILGEMMAQLIERKTTLGIQRELGLGGTMIAHGALERGGIDLYAEYTGTALTVILDRQVLSDPDSVLAIVQHAYSERFDLEWLAPFGFDNSYALAVRQAEARRGGWRSISDLVADAGGLTAGFPAEFVERPDGYPALQRVYGLAFGDVRDMEPTLMYEAVANGEVDVISAFTTDGRIRAYDLAILRDDRRAFPPYRAAPVARASLLRLHPEVRDALAPLAGALSDSTMRRLNYAVDERKRDPARVAREFLRSRGMVE